MSSEDAQLQGRIDELNQRLQLSEERLRCLMSLSADGILIVDTAGTIQVANPAAVALFSHLSSTLVGCTFGYPLLAENGVEIDLVQDNGAMRVLEMRGAATTWNEAAAIMISLREITQGAEPKDAAHGLHAQLEQQREREMAELRAANADLERAASLKDEFLATMSHELRTPLNAILSLARILHEQLGSILSARQHQSFDVISESGHHLLEIINDILDLTKVQSGMMTLNIESVPVEQLCTSALHVVRQAAEQKQLELRVAIEPDIVAIQADRLRVKQILLNLLSNAVKFTPDGGAIGLEVRKRPDAGYVDFAVWDTGIGIAHSDLDRLFKPFVQLPSSASHNIPGTGLGLALAAKLARQHGGDISVESRMGEGSRFTLTLPWNADDRLPLPIADVAAEPSKAHSGESQRLILLAEDNE
ncbi:MAG: PAS domain S-box protein, partial [Caldilineaceae bacterium]|nr:PAS domain S-box protein [Caldilineaceae bacterium]